MTKTTFLANIKGPEGARGLRGQDGIPGMDAVPTDEAVAAYLTTEGTASNAAAAGAPDKGDGLVAALDQRRTANVIVLGDSTGTPTYGEWPARLGTTLGTRYPGIKVQSRLYSDTAYGTPTELASGLQNLTVASDTFARTASALVGSTPDVGGVWTGATGKYTLDGANAKFVNDSTGVTAQQIPSTTTGRMTTTVNWSLIYDGGAHLGAYYTMSSFVNSSTFLWIEIAANTGVITFKKSTVGGGTVNLGTKTLTEAGIVSGASAQTVVTSIAHVGDTVTYKAGSATASFELTSADSTTFAGGTSSGFWGTTNDHLVTSITTTALVPATATFDIYNGSVGSTKADYPVSRIASMIPVGPDAVVINYGHNHATETPATFETALDGLITAIRGTYPGTPIIISGQNPQYSPTANPAQHNARQADLRRYARAKGFGYIPVFEAFMAQGAPRAYVAGDGVHPTITGTTDGAALWTKTAADYLNRLSLRP